MKKSIGLLLLSAVILSSCSSPKSRKQSEWNKSVDSLVDYAKSKGWPRNKIIIYPILELGENLPGKTNSPLTKYSFMRQWDSIKEFTVTSGSVVEIREPDSILNTKKQ